MIPRERGGRKNRREFAETGSDRTTNRSLLAAQEQDEGEEESAAKWTH